MSRIKKVPFITMELWQQSRRASGSVLPPEIWQEAVIQQMSPSGPIMRALATDVILMLDVVLRQGLVERDAAFAHSPARLGRALPEEEVRVGAGTTERSWNRS